MLFPRHLSIRGFRGFRAQTEFSFDGPATIFFGENHSGKSSTLNAIEWCLFGDDCLGKQTGIRERVGWIVPNRHMPVPDVRVELELMTNAGAWVIERQLKTLGKRAATSSLQLTLPDGECLTGSEAERSLARLVRSEFRDFLTTVYQHQEAIRAILTQEPKDRNDAIDRLLGLSVYRSLLRALTLVKATDRQRSLRQKYDAFQGLVQATLATREKDLEQMRQEAVAVGIPLKDQNEATALNWSAGIRELLVAFSRESGLELGSLQVPAVRKEIPIFEAETRKVIIWLRSHIPAIKEQQDWFRRRSDLLRLKEELASALGNLEAIARSIQELEQEFGGRLAVAAQLAEIERLLEEERTQLRKSNKRAALIQEAIGYLESLAKPGPAEVCPLCGKQAPDLLISMRHQWEHHCQATEGKMGLRIQELEQQQRRWALAAERYRNVDAQGQTGMKRLAQARQELAERLGRALDPEDDPMALLQKELEAVEDRAKRLQELAEGKLLLLEEIDRQCDRVRLIREMLVKEEKQRVLEKIQDSPAFQALEGLLDRMAERTADLDAIQAAVSGVSHEEAQEKLEMAERTIDNYFRELAHHPAVTGIRLRVGERGQRNEYTITDTDGNDLTPILSQGDLNALALAIFLGLASASADNGPFGFVMLDDPSQSLGSENKKNLVRLLDEVARKKKLFLATMDRELQGLLATGLTKAKTEYLFGEWKPETGPSINKR